MASQSRVTEQLDRVAAQQSYQKHMAKLPLSLARPLAQLRLQGHFTRATEHEEAGQCRLCRAQCVETTLHLLLDCEGAKQVMSVWLGEQGAECAAQSREAVASTALGAASMWPTTTVAELARRLETECSRKGREQNLRWARGDGRRLPSSSSSSD